MRMMAIAIAAEEGWPVEAVLVDQDNPEGPLRRWCQGPLSEASEIDVSDLIRDRSWRWMSVELPEQFEEGYIASVRGLVRWVRGAPPTVPTSLPSWMLAIPNPDRQARFERRAPIVAMVIGALGFLVGGALFLAGERGAWFNTAWGVVLFWQGLVLRNGRPSLRFVALRLAPIALFTITTIVAARASAHDFRVGRTGSGWVALGATLLNIAIVTVFVMRAFSDRRKRAS
jgi:hypothetical protein